MSKRISVEEYKETLSTYQRRVYELELVAIRTDVGDFAANNLEMRVVDIDFRKLRELRTWLLKKEHRVGEHDIPISWWQHFKRDALPGWIQRRWPVQTRHLVEREIHLCPHPNRKVDSHTNLVCFDFLDTRCS